MTERKKWHGEDNLVQASDEERDAEDAGLGDDFSYVEPKMLAGILKRNA